VCAVSYLNTAPLVWGALCGPQSDALDLTFATPAECADRVAAGRVQVGILPVVEIARHGFACFQGTGIAGRGAVRTILLITRKPFSRVETLATDTGSRTSVQLARIILAERYGAAPRLLPMHPDLDAMLEAADAALIIGDAALALDPATLPYPCLDLGEEWEALTGLPMVFALWAGRPEFMTPGLERVLEDSCHYGLAHLDEVIAGESRRRGFRQPLVRDYLTRNLVFLLGAREHAGMQAYLKLAAELEPAPALEASSR
jgi:predicted solute-binding protein